MKHSARALSVAMIGILGLDCTLPVAVQAECYEKVPLRPIHRTFIRRDVVEPGVYEVARSPSVYGLAEENAGAPGRVVWHEEAAVYRTVPLRIRRSGGWVWEKQFVNGKEALCRVRLPATYITVEKRVLVSRGRRWAERIPASPEFTERRILLKPYKNVTRFQRPYIAYYREHLTIQPEGYRWHKTAASPDC